MKIRLYNFLKKPNSTKRPAGTDTYTEYDCVLKDETSIINPAVLLKVAAASEPPAWNYAYIAAFNRYYFIQDITADGPQWVLSMTCDILATYKNTIEGSSLYLLRCSSLYDGNIVDSYYPVKTEYTVGVIETVTPWLHNGSSEHPSLDLGCFILGIVAEPGTSPATSFGSIKYIAIDRTNLNLLIDSLMDAGTLVSGDITIDGLSDEAVKSVIDPISFIKSCQWCPMLYSDMTPAEMTGLDIWSWSLPTIKYKTMPTNPPYYSWSVTFTNIQKHPQASRGAYLNTSPYTKLCARIPPFGLLELDSLLAAPVTTIIGQITYDLITGQAILEIYYGSLSGPPACRITSQVGVPIQLSQVYNDYINAVGGAVQGAVGTIGSLLTGNILGAITGGISAIGSAVNAMRPVLSNTGGNGGFSDLRGKARLYSEFYEIPDEDLQHAGRPLCQSVVISTLTSGSYCLAMTGDIEIPGTEAEQNELKNILESGFYYE